MRRIAMTLTEILIGLSIMSILAGVMTLNSNTIGQQTARREAERVAAFFRTHIHRANMTHDVVWFTVSVAGTPNRIDVQIGDNKTYPLKTDKLEAMEKCSFSPNLKLVYNKNSAGQYYTIPADASVDIGPENTAFHCLTVTGADGKTCTVRISK